jgi:hypothetical protein
MRASLMSAITTSPSAKPAAMASCVGWAATRVQLTPSPPADAVEQLRRAAAVERPLRDERRRGGRSRSLPFLVKDSAMVFAG